MAKGVKTGGRKAGTPNKVTAELKESILMALDKAGGVDYLVGLSTSHPPAFASLLGRVLPMTVQGGGEDGAFTVVVKKFGP
jgi:hypothetical protein